MAAVPDRREQLAIRQELEALLIEYWYDVDMNWGREAHLYYTEDGRYVTSQKTRVGREAIRQFYTDRHDRGARISLHLVQNFRCVVESAERASCNWVLSLYANDGEPILPSKPPIMIADVRDVVLREADGQWRCQSRVIKALFKDFDTPTTG